VVPHLGFDKADPVPNLKLLEGNAEAPRLQLAGTDPDVLAVDALAQ